MKDIIYIGLLFVIFFIFYIVAFFSSSETAFLSLNKIKIRTLLQKREKNAKVVSELKDDLDEVLTVVLIGTNFMNSLASSLATYLALQVLGNSGIGLATVFITFFATTFGQIIPKTEAALDSSKIALHNGPILKFLLKSLFPIVKFFSLVSRFGTFIVEHIIHTNALITEEEFKTLIEMSESNGTLEKNDKNLLYNIFKFNDLQVMDIMRHRSLIQGVAETSSREDVIKAFNETSLKILLVYKESMDTIVGSIHYKSVLFSTQSKASRGYYGKISYAQNIMKRVLFVPETMSVLELLSKLKKERTELAIALNEQGATAGIITIDDIIRVVFGRMTDDIQTNVPPETRIKFIGYNEFIVPGDMSLEDVNDILKLNLDSENYDTLGGWLMEHIDNLPRNGEVFLYNNLVFIVEEQSRRRIVSIRIKIKN